MGTTLVIVELLIIGFQVLVWAALFLWPLPKEWFSSLCLDKDWARLLQEVTPLLSVGALAAVYTLGLVFDRFVGWATTWLLRKLAWLLHKLDRLLGWLASRICSNIAV